MRWIKFTILLSVVMLWAWNSEAQTSGGGPTTHSPTLSVTDGVNTCYPYQISVSGGSISCNSGIVTLPPTGGGSGSGTVTTGNIYDIAYYPATGNTVTGSNYFFYNNGNVGVGTFMPTSLFDVQGSTGIPPAGTATAPIFTVNGGGIAGELVNKGYELIMNDPVGGIGDEVQGLEQYQNNLYIGYYTQGTSAPIYKWDGNKETSFYNIGKGSGSFSDFSGVGALQEYNGNLYAGLQSNNSTNGGIYVYNPSATINNFIQFPSSGLSLLPQVTIPNDNTNNAIFGSTAFSVEYYGRIDDLGSNNSGQIIWKLGTAATSGYRMDIGINNTITVSIDGDGSLKNTAVTNSNAFSIGSYHDIIFSWTSGGHAIIYVDGIAASLASSVTVTTPANDTLNEIVFGNNQTQTIGHPFSGTFRRVRIWRNYAVTSSDATSLAAGGSATSSPTGQYLFTEGSGTTTADSSGNSNTGTIVSPAYWNNTTFDVSYANGNDVFIYALAVFKGNLYAGAGYTTSRIYSYNGTTWSTVYNGLSGSGLVLSFYVYKGLLFAALGGVSNAAILSTSDGINWTVEETVPASIASQFNRFVEFKGNLYVGTFKGNSGSNDIYKRSSTGTWAVEIPSISAGQVWGMNNYNNAMYVGATTTGGGTIYKSYDGFHFTTDFVVPNASQTEPFNMYNYNGSLYIGMGFLSNSSGTVYRKTDSVGQQTDWLNNVFGNHVYCNTQNSYNWTNDCSLTTYSSPWIFNSNVGIGLQTGNPANSAIDAIGGVSIGATTASVYTNISAPNGGIIAEGNVGIGSTSPGRALDVQGTIRTTAFTMSTSPTTGYVLTAINTLGDSSWQPSGGSGGGVASITGDGLIHNNSASTGAVTLTNATQAANTVIGATGTTLVALPVNSCSTASSALTWTTGSGFGCNTISGSGANPGGSATQLQYQVNGTTFGGVTGSSVVNGNIGIGSISPGQILDVQGTSRFIGSGNALIVGNGAVQMGFNPTSASLGTLSNNSFNLLANNTVYLHITPTGNVGIDNTTTSATNNFDINGNMAVGAYAGVNTATGNGIIVSGRVGIGTYNPAGSLDVEIPNLPIILDGRITTSNVGIGSALPNSMLDVEGTVSPAVFFAAIPATGTNKNVGIGSFNPGQLLDVQGTVRMSKLGTTLSIASGTNGCQGQATLSGGTVTVSTTCAPATSQGIFLQDATTGSLVNVGTPTVGTVTGGTSFVINSSNALDASNVNWWILKSS